MSMNFYISTNYFEIIREDIIFYDIDNSKIYFVFSFRVSNSEFYFNFMLFHVSNSKILICLFNSS